VHVSERPERVVAIGAATTEETRPKRMQRKKGEPRSQKSDVRSQKSTSKKVKE